jgi:hypothetical protein
LARVQNLIRRRVNDHHEHAGHTRRYFVSLRRSQADGSLDVWLRVGPHENPRQGSLGAKRLLADGDHSKGDSRFARLKFLTKGCLCRGSERPCLRYFRCGSSTHGSVFKLGAYLTVFGELTSLKELGSKFLGRVFDTATPLGLGLGGASEFVEHSSRRDDQCWPGRIRRAAAKASGDDDRFCWVFQTSASSWGRCTAWSPNDIRRCICLGAHPNLLSAYSSASRVNCSAGRGRER